MFLETKLFQVYARLVYLGWVFFILIFSISSFSFANQRDGSKSGTDFHLRDLEKTVRLESLGLGSEQAEAYVAFLLRGGHEIPEWVTNAPVSTVMGRQLLNIPTKSLIQNWEQVRFEYQVRESLVQYLIKMVSKGDFLPTLETLAVRFGFNEAAKRMIGLFVDGWFQEIKEKQESWGRQAGSLDLRLTENGHGYRSVSSVRLWISSLVLDPEFFKQLNFSWNLVFVSPKRGYIKIEKVVPKLILLEVIHQYIKKFGLTPERTKELLEILFQKSVLIDLKVLDILEQTNVNIDLEIPFNGYLGCGYAAQGVPGEVEAAPLVLHRAEKVIKQSKPAHLEHTLSDLSSYPDRFHKEMVWEESRGGPRSSPNVLCDLKQRQQHYVLNLIFHLSKWIQSEQETEKFIKGVVAILKWLYFSSTKKELAEMVYAALIRLQPLFLKVHMDEVRELSSLLHLINAEVGKRFDEWLHSEANPSSPTTCNVELESL